MITVKVRTIARLKEIVGQEEIDIPVPQGSTVNSLIELMAQRWGEELSAHLSAPRHDQPLPHARILVNGQDIAFLKGIATILREGDEVLMLSLVGGG